MHGMTGTQATMQRSASKKGDRGLGASRLSAVFVVAVIAIGLLPSTALAATATATTLGVASDSVGIPIGEQTAVLLVTAHVSPAPQPFEVLSQRWSFASTGT